MKSWYCKSLGVLLLLPSIGEAAGPVGQALPTIVMSAFATPGLGKPRSLNTLIYTEAFHRLGYHLIVIPLPPLRATILVESDLVDGELERSAEYGAAHPSLVRIEEVTQTLTLGAYVSDQKIKINGWNSLLMTRYRFEYRTGIRVAQVAIPSYIPQEQISVIRTTEQGLQKLAVGRTDVYIDFDERVKWTMKMQTLLHDGHIFRSGTIQQVKINAYLSRKRAALAPELTTVLRSMKQEGVIANYERITKNDSDWALVSR
jgi:hypothetical protein